ncbi:MULTISPECIES: tape measure protein [Pseudomonas]|uniref:tape measure protein n=1 Tax=Pseudomonas TaxID=286 RepID=UPI0002A17499|nr:MULTISPECIES: tape measure protein [Pseudomonas]AGA72989.1 phage-related minor tail protein [Pseudomonas putida HB3267]MCE1101979.1 tape measure protein [Pseudomonas asiatica]MCE1107513.1 tape measure protein [Pseudomonas asiatica]WJR25039.1 tape measure protein [Pseudomonas asiatica]
MNQESRLAVTIDSRGAQRDARAITKDLGSLEAAGNRVDPAMGRAETGIREMGNQASTSASKVRTLEGQTDRLASAVTGLAGPIAAAFSVAKIAAAAEQYVNLTNRLRLVTESAEQLAFAQDSVYQVAQNARQSLEVTAQVYQRVAQNARQLGLDFSDVASVTETVAKTVALSGASAQAADAAMVQFGQALASGTLRGDELNSILEQTPALAQAIARGLGVTIGQLRTMGAEGKLTSEAVVRALQNQKDKVDELSSAMTLTVSQAVTAFNNALVATVGRLDEATGASSRLANGIAALARAMDGFNSGEFLDFFRQDKQTVAGLNNELSVTLSGIRDLQNARSRLAKDDPSDTVFFKFQFYDKAELDAEIRELEGKAAGIRTIVSSMEGSAAKIGAQTPKGDAPAEGSATAVNAEYEKMLASLKKQASLQGENTEAAKVRYAIENGELGKLLPEQEKLLLQYAEEKDRKAAAEKAAKSLGSANARANTESAKSLSEALGVFTKLYGQYDPAAQAVRSLTHEQQQLQLALDRGAISQIEYSNALAQASLNYAAIVQGQDQHLVRLKQINEEYVKGQSLAELYAQKSAATEIQGPAGKIAQAGIDSSINNQVFSGKPNTSQIDAVIGGAGSELMRMTQENEQLQAWYDQRIAMYQQYRELEVENAAQYDETIRQLEKQRAEDTVNNERSMSVARLSLAEGMFGDLTSIVGAFAGQQSGAYKAMFAVQKAASIAQSIISIQTGIAMAAANPFPLNLAAMASVAAATASIVGNIQSVGLNLATGGYVRGPGTGTSDSIPANLSNGEFVVNAAATKRNRALLEAINSNERVSVAGGGGAVVSTQAGSSGASGIQQNIYIQNHTTAQVEQRRMPNGDLEFVIREATDRAVQEVAGQLASGYGDVVNAGEGAYGWKRPGD